jgi:quercetin dioxygenase-like cupin family protein
MVYFDVVVKEGRKYRLFRPDVENGELFWHQDEYDRVVTIMSGNGWKFQKDDELPTELKEGDEIFIPNHQYHRLLKGKDNLVLRIIENK